MTELLPWVVAVLSLFLALRFRLQVEKLHKEVERYRAGRPAKEVK